MLVSCLLLVVGFVLLIKGADFFVEGASNVAKRFNVSPLIIGLTIVAFGTSLPEASVSISAGIAGSNDLSLSNIVGSNIFNLLVVIGVSVLFTDMAIDKKVLKREFPLSIIATLLLWFMITPVIIGKQNLSRLDGVILLVLFAGFLFVNIYECLKANKALSEKEKEENRKIKLFKNIILLIVGLAGIIFGGDLIVKNATNIATMLGVSETLIGLTIVALGTSLPELVTSIVALCKGSNDIAIGNVVGSNLFNILFILGASSTLSPLSVDSKLAIDTLILLGASILTFVFCVSGKKVTKWEGIVMLLIYFAYLAYMFIREGIFTF